MLVGGAGDGRRSRRFRIISVGNVVLLSLGRQRRSCRRVSCFQQNQPEPITPGDGALVGLLAGLGGACIYLVLSIPIDIVFRADGAEDHACGCRELAGTDAAQRAADSWRTSFGAAGPRSSLGFMLMLFLGRIFSTLGGLLGAAIFRKKPAQPQIIDIPPLP